MTIITPSSQHQSLTFQGLPHPVIQNNWPHFTFRLLEEEPYFNKSNTADLMECLLFLILMGIPKNSGSEEVYKMI